MARMVNNTLPPKTQHFLSLFKARDFHDVVPRFHRWMSRRSLDVAQLQPQHSDAFAERPCEHPVSRATRNRYRSTLHRYLCWLHDQGELSFRPQSIRPPPRSLPPTVVRFVRELQVTLKPATCQAYAGSLRIFHSWLEERGVAHRDLERRLVVDWLVHLNKQQLDPSTRYAIITRIRVYLRWLAEQQELHNESETLLMAKDCPKLPRRLPRPLPPDADRQLQQRLEQSGDRYPLGLLLMRNTGIRVGELMNLPSDCTSQDPLGNQFLKVPLGKLNNERLVPIDDKTSHIIERLRSMASPGKPWLLQTPLRCKTYNRLYNRALREACQGLHIGGRVTTHRLRHTYATALLSGGMSLVGIMKLLGHQTLQMTLKYADITEETVGREYREALAVTEKRYPTPERFQHHADTDPHALLAEVIRWLQDTSPPIPSNQTKARNLVRRIKRLQVDLAALTP